MLEEIWEAATGKWGLIAIALLALPGGRKFARSAAKEVVKAGMTISENVKDLVAEIKEEASDVVAEVKAERKASNSDRHDKHTASHKSHD